MRLFALRWWIAVGAVGLALSGCNRYPQDSPDALLVSARKMVQDGQAEKLQELLYAETPQMRRVLVKLGTTLGHVQDLATTINEKFPDEVAALRKQAEEAAAAGEASSLLGRAVLGELGGRGGRRRGGAAGDPDEMRASFDRVVKELFADPYGWLARSENRLSTVAMGDDMAAVLWDGKPIFPPLGLGLRESGGKWYVALPTSLPGIANIMPRTDDEYKIWVSVVTVFDRLVIDLTKDVRSGKAKDLRALSELAGEKAFIPVAIGVLAYGKAVEAREKEAGREPPPPVAAPENQPTPEPAPADPPQ
jgi:hypothetical protein